jgi:hypothetical protein
MTPRYIPKDMALLLLIKLRDPGGLAAVAVAVVGSHGDFDA